MEDILFLGPNSALKLAAGCLSPSGPSAAESSNRLRKQLRAIRSLGLIDPWPTCTRALKAAVRRA